MRIKISKPLSIYEIGQRDNQEDSLWPSAEALTEDASLFILCDGMGGHERGEVASQTVCREMSEYITAHVHEGDVISDEMFVAALDATYTALDKLDDDAAKKMGCTLTFLCLHKGGCLMAHIGDSRIYHIRPQTKEILYCSRDHSLVQELYQMGEITYEQMRVHPRRNVIMRAVQPGKDYRMKADIAHTTDIKPGDYFYFYLCSDGMLEQTEDEELLDVFCANASDDAIRSKLENDTAYNKDNHTAFIIRIEDVIAEEGDNLYPNDEATSRSNAIVIRREMEKREALRTAAVETMPQPTQTQPEPSPAQAPAPQRNRAFAMWIWGIIAMIAIVAVVFLLVY